MNTFTRVSLAAIAVTLGLTVLNTSSVQAVPLNQELLVNGNFEATPMGDGWFDTDGPMTAVGAWTPNTHSGANSALLGGTVDSWDYVYQDFTIPTNAVSVTASTWIKLTSTETLPGYDTAWLRVLKASDLNVSYCDVIVDPATTTLGTWMQPSCTVSAPRGEEVIIVIGVRNDATLTTTVHADDASVIAALDVTAPVLTRNGNSLLLLAKNSAYTEPGVTATDDVDASVTLVTTGTVNSAVLGDYLLTYSATDQAGNAATPVTRTVRVYEPSSLAALSSAITTAENLFNGAVQGTQPGQYPAPLKANLLAVVVTARSVTTADAQSTINWVLIQLNAAMTTFKAGVVPTSVVPTVVTPVPQVLGETTVSPVMKTLNLTKGIYSYKLNGKTISIRPFDATYTGAVWARSIDFGADGKVFVFLNSSAGAKNEIKVYSAAGKLLKVHSPFGATATTGLNATAVVESNNQVYLAVAPVTVGTTVKVYTVSVKGLTVFQNLVASKTPGNILVSFQKLYKNQFGLVTKKVGDSTTRKIWKLDFATKKFIEDTKIGKK